MPRTEEEITRALMIEIAGRLRDEGVTLYQATRILGYILVGLAEALPETLQQERDGAEAK